MFLKKILIKNFTKVVDFFHLFQLVSNGITATTFYGEEKQITMEMNEAQKSHKVEYSKGNTRRGNLTGVLIISLL